MLPHDIRIQLGNETYMDEMIHWMANKESVQIYNILKSLGLAGYDKTSETVRLSSDIRHMYALYSHGARYQTTGMRTLKLYAQDKDNEIMDRSVLRQNFFLVFQNEDKNEKTTSKTTIVPFEFELDFIHKFQSGVSSRFGHTQELKSERLGLSIKM